MEGAYQFGTTTQGTDHAAGFAMAGLGHTWADSPWSPTLTAYYDWASGGNLQGGRRGFDHLFPLAHKYLGFMDLFGRSNINTPNVLLTMKPNDKCQVLLLLSRHPERYALQRQHEPLSARLYAAKPRFGP
jgi:hypothetical protein